MILSDWRDTDAGTTENLKQVALFLLCINISTGTTPDLETFDSANNNTNKELKMNKHIKTANLSRVTWVEEQGRPLQANPVTFPTSLPSKLHLIFINLTFEQELR